VIFDHDSNAANPTKPAPGEPVQAGYDFYDISNPGEPKELGFVLTRPGGATHGFEIDDRYVYGGANAPESKAESGRRARVTPPAISKIGRFERAVASQPPQDRRSWLRGLRQT
jgi:hypothetical protein